MRGLIFGMMAVLALPAGAGAADCSGQGSLNVLSFDAWSLVPDGNGAVELSYRLDGDKPVTLLAAHVYFETTAGDRRADAALELVDPAGLPRAGTATISLSKPMVQRLSAAAPGRVSVYSCTNVMQYRDGSGVIID